MAVQMATVGGLGASTRKLSHTDAIETIKHFPPLIVELERLEQSSEKVRDLSGHLTLRSVSWDVLKRTPVSARDK
jgi:hypothetical protein